MGGKWSPEARAALMERRGKAKAKILGHEEPFVVKQEDLEPDEEYTGRGKRIDVCYHHCNGCEEIDPKKTGKISGHFSETIPCGAPDIVDDCHRCRQWNANFIKQDKES